MHSPFIQVISIAPIQVHHYSDALQTQHGCCVRVSSRSATGNWEWKTIPRSLRGGYRAGFEPTKGIYSANAPLLPITYVHCSFSLNKSSFSNLFVLA